MLVPVHSVKLIPEQGIVAVRRFRPLPANAEISAEADYEHALTDLSDAVIRSIDKPERDHIPLSRVESRPLPHRSLQPRLVLGPVLAVPRTEMGDAQLVSDVVEVRPERLTQQAAHV